jgi:hypothetical protein
MFTRQRHEVVSCACQDPRNNLRPVSVPAATKLQRPAHATFLLQRPALPTLRFFAHTQTLNLLALSVVLDANEKFGVIFTSSCHLALRALASLPARAWRDSRLHSASENSGPKKARLLSSGAVAEWTGVSMGVGAKIVCSQE